MQSFSIFAINLPMDTERRQAIERQLLLLGAKYEIVDGVLGNDPRVTKRYDPVRAIKEHGKPLILGEQGCALAHALIYERIVKERIPYTLILEDDIVLPPDFLEIVEAEVQKKHKKWDWLLFDYRYTGLVFLWHWFIASGVTIRKKPLFFFYVCLKVPYIIPLSLFEFVREQFARKNPSYRGAKYFYRPLYNAGAYILTLEGAKKLLPFTDPLRLTADQLPNVARIKANFRLYGYVPLIVRQNTVDFETTAGRSDQEWRAILEK